MPVGWFLAPYKRRVQPLEAGVARYCAVDDFTAQVLADGGWWEESEGLGDQAVVKVRASQATLTAIGTTAGILEVPRRWVRLLDTFADMTNGERNQIQSRLLSAGFAQAEINAALGANLNEWRTRSLADLLRLICSRRLKPRYDRVADAIVVDGPVQPTRPVEEVDLAVEDG